MLFPFNFFKLPNDTTGVLPQLQHPDTLIHPDTLLHPHSLVHPDSLANPESLVNPDTLVVTKFTVTNIDQHDHKHCNKLNTKIGDDRFDDDLSGVLDNFDDADDLNSLRNALKQRLQNKNSGDTTGDTTGNTDGTANYNAYDNPDGKVAAKDVNSGNTANSVNNTPNSVDNTANSSDNTSNSVNNKKSGDDSFYDHLPFMPHPGETEGESEEVSKDEFPPETNDLTPEGKSEVVVLYKLQKRCNHTHSL